MNEISQQRSGLKEGSEQSFLPSFRVPKAPSVGESRILARSHRLGEREEMAMGRL